MAATWATNEVTPASTLHDRRIPVEELATAQISTPSEPQGKQTLKATSPRPVKEDIDAPKQELEAGRADKATDSSSTSTACTPYEEEAQELSPRVRDCATTPRAVGDNVHLRSTDRNEAKGGEAPSSVQTSEPLEGRGAGAPFVQRSDLSAERSFKTPGVKGTLQMSGVRAGNMTIALGGNDPFLQVKTCDQLRRTNVVAGKGEHQWSQHMSGGRLCTGEL